jgi:ABC-type branched-subunit amino acid transport system substrate-binding protein
LSSYLITAINIPLLMILIRVVIPFWRTDIYGNDLVKAMKHSLQELGGRVDNGVGYIPTTGDFAASLIE